MKMNNQLDGTSLRCAGLRVGESEALEMAFAVNSHHLAVVSHGDVRR